MARAYRYLIAVLLMVVFWTPVSKTEQVSTAPEFGAQVWIEPGQTEEEVDRWFQMLVEHDMPVARFFIMWDYIEPEPGEWDFHLYDRAFDAAQKYGVSVVATLTTNRRSRHRGDYYQLHGHQLESTWDRLNESKIYIKQVVSHYMDHPALDAWIPTNEASQRPSPHPLAIDRFREWLRGKYGTVNQLNQAWTTNFTQFDSVSYADPWQTGHGYWYWVTPFVDWHTFWREHLRWWLEWIVAEVRKYDREHPVHGHTGGIVGNIARRSHDIPSWRGFANSLGATIHPSWHFGDFDRSQFALAVAYNCDLLMGSSEPKSYWITELQAGTNIHSGGAHPLTPTPEDIAQWVWTGIGSGADRVLFWLLDNRKKGNEAGEWSMLDYQNHPSDRFGEGSNIAKHITDNAEVYGNAAPARAPIYLIASLETMTLQAWKPRNDYLGRDDEAHLFSLYGYYKALHELGIPVHIKHMHDFDWTAPSESPRLAILPHVSAITEDQAQQIKQFVASGNTVLCSGLSGVYDEEAKFWPLESIPLAEMLGATLKEIRLIENQPRISLDSPANNLPSHLWIGEIRNNSARVIGEQNGWITAVRNQYGDGEVLWIPSLIGLGAWQRESEPLAAFLDDVTSRFVGELPLRFESYTEDMVLRIMESEEQYLAIVTNGRNAVNHCTLRVEEGLEGSVFWGRQTAFRENHHSVQLDPRETVVLLYQ